MMDVRVKMTGVRKKFGLSIEEMAERCKCSSGLLRNIEENGWITHPNIATRIASKYRLNVDEYNQLVFRDYVATKLPKPVEPPCYMIWGKTSSNNHFVQLHKAMTRIEAIAWLKKNGKGYSSVRLCRWSNDESKRYDPNNDLSPHHCIQKFA